MYTEDQLLMLSGIQHFSFCRRQWALIHIEQLWNENLFTVEGNILHERAHDNTFAEKRGDVITSRGMAVFSHTLGVTGVCDVVELHLSPDGIPIFGRDGKYLPVPVEYKRGKPKESDADRLQLCCQAMCLEEMLVCDIPEGFLYYGETHRREKVAFTPALRQTVTDMLCEMHQLYQRQYTPKVKPSKACKACSLENLCLPKLCKNISAQAYVQAAIKEVTL